MCHIASFPTLDSKVVQGIELCVGSNLILYMATMAMLSNITRRGDVCIILVYKSNVLLTCMDPALFFFLS